MNIFLPYENDILKSVASLDNRRLNKQILEAQILLRGAISFQRGLVPNSYFKHPVAQFYKNNPRFLAYYGYVCAKEWEGRTLKRHKLCDYFLGILKGDTVPPNYTPYYMEGSKGTENCIRTTEQVSVLFQAKLIKKWTTDISKKMIPSWDWRGKPKFYEDYLALDEQGQTLFWENIEKIKGTIKNGKQETNN